MGRNHNSQKNPLHHEAKARNQPKERVMTEIMRSGNELTQMEVKQRIALQGLCSERTIERKIKALIQEVRIIKIGERNAILKVAS